MEDGRDVSPVTMHITRGCLVVPVQVELYDEVMLKIQEDILEMIRETGIKGVIIDVSGVNIIDIFIAQAIIDTAGAAGMLGAETVLTGLKPSVVASVVDMDLDFKNIRTALNLEEGLREIAFPETPEESEAEIVETLYDHSEHGEETDDESFEKTGD